MQKGKKVREHPLSKLILKNYIHCARKEKKIVSYVKEQI